MQNNVFVSICIPTYNGALYLNKCLKSVLNQTYNFFDIIISDDNSTDNTVEIANSLLSKADINYKIINNKSSVGVADNWNNAIKNASGQYIKMLFQDDYLYPDCIKKMISLAETNKELGFIFSLRDIIYEKQIENDFETRCILDHKQYLRDLPQIQEGIDLINNKYLLNGSNIIGEPSHVLIRKNVFNEIGYFNPSIIQLIDIDMWYRILLKYKVGFINESLSVFRIHDNQLSNKNKKYFAKVENEKLILLKSLYENLVNINYNKFALSILDQNIRRISISNKIYWKMLKPFWKFFYSLKNRIFKLFNAENINNSSLRKN